MSQLSDKDFDKLFSEVFENFSEEPSSKVWFSVENDLERQQRANKKIRLAQWSVAASVVLCLATAALYLTNKQHLKGDQVAVVNTNDPNPDKETRNRAVIIQSPKIRASQPETEVRSEGKENKESKEQKNVPVRKKESSKSKAGTTQWNAESSETRLAKISTTEPSLIQSKGNVKAVPSDQCIPVVEPKLLHQALVAYDESEDGKAIPTVGDALNYIAAKVDKRDKKFLAINKKGSNFSLNLGLVKIERKRQQEEEESSSETEVR
ncbi:hypothetical protein C3K47_10000 [Solitalea longa]|uniref:Uncharacterized protein n=1 Tax=Solitalea longa TaxID=2079460 RepID=A0A2S5A311_9SPHI|nr:hypothetical protein [Solitalea longa]POY36689.1 hypothetical protein C3K47_10000 [Solitalea longa]